MLQLGVGGGLYTADGLLKNVTFTSIELKLPLKCDWPSTSMRRSLMAWLRKAAGSTITVSASIKSKSHG